MKKLTLVLTTLMALPTMLSCATAKPKTFFQRVADHSGKILCGAFALIIGYFLFKSSAQKPAPQQRQTPPKPPIANNQDQEQLAQKAADEASAKAQNDFFARQRARHQRHLAQLAAAEKAEKERGNAEFAAKLAAAQPVPQQAPQPEPDLDHVPAPQQQSAPQSLMFDAVVASQR